MIKKKIKLNVYDIVINIETENSFSITSSLKDGKGKKEKQIMEGIENMILGHAQAGLNIQDPLYIKGIVNAVVITSIMERKNV